MRSIARGAAALAGAAVLSILLLATPASATPPVAIPPGQFVVDDAGVLGSEASRVRDAVRQLQERESQNLFVVLVDEFSSPNDPEAWVNDVAEKKGMGPSDSILAIAVDARQLRLKSDNAGPIAEHDQAIANEYILPELRGGNLTASDWADAAVGATKGIEAAASGDLAGSGDARGAGSPDAGSDSGSAAPWIIGGVVVVGGGTLWALSRRKRLPGAGTPQGPQPGADGRPVDPLAALSVEELRAKAGPLLIAADDAIRSSEQEVGFAMAEFGEEAIKPFAEDIQTAKAHLNESFKLQQQLDDSVPDTEADQRTWLGDIIRRCEAVNATLEEHKEDFNALRELERNAPQAVEALRQQVPALRSGLEAAQASLRGLADRYADTALVQVRDNIEQARERLDFIDSAVRTADAKIAAGETAEAAVAVRTGEEGVHQARVLIDAIGKTGKELDEARSDLESAVAATAQDLAQARAVLANGQHPELAGPAAAVEQSLGRVREGMQAGRMDPLALLAGIEQARGALDAPLTAIRDQRQQAQRAAQQLQAAVRTAQVKIDGTDDFIRARRGGVGATARTRLAEAQRNLDEALRLGQHDPVAALQYANQAAYLADQAARQAESDVDGFGGGHGGGGFGGGFGGGRGSGLGGAILGGILIDSILRGGGGGHSGGGIFGGGGFGGFGDGGGGGFGGGGFDGGGGGGSF